MNNRSGKRPGFTMIEMLTVIAVIAILAAILFPVFSQVKKRVHQASCINNMHQISQALNLYHDSNNRYPLALDECNGRPGEGRCTLTSTCVGDDPACVVK